MLLLKYFSIQITLKSYFWIQKGPYDMATDPFGTARHPFRDIDLDE